MLSVVDDSGYKQGYETVKMLYLILEKGQQPGDIPSIAPDRGPFIVNQERARMLGITLTPEMEIEEYVEQTLALKQFPNPR
jgi:ABC-type uncharacterized transport system substrate-binding protein